jgi:hypothetical protein
MDLLKSKKSQQLTMASMKSRFRPARDAKLHMLAGPLYGMRAKKDRTSVK